MAPTAEDEAAFMQQLLAGMDDSSTPDEKPVTPHHRSSPPREPTSKPAPEPLGTPSKSRPQRASRTPLSKPRSGVEHDFASLCAGAEDWEWDDMGIEDGEPEDAEAQMTGPPRAHDTSHDADFCPPQCARCIVENIDHSQSGPREVNLLVKLDNTQERRKVVLRGQWTLTDVHVGDIINIIGSFIPIPSTSTSTTSPVSTITISSDNLLILHPDLLLPITSIANSAQCERRPLIQSLISSRSDITPALVWGNMLHEIFQACLAEGRWDKKFLDSKIEEEVRKDLASLVKLGLGTETAKAELKARAVGVLAFSEKYVCAQPKSGSEMISLPDTGSAFRLAITGLHDVEEDIWSPTYGIKGKIDATLQTTVECRDGPSMETRSLTVPFEIKTGRSVGGVEHRAQTLLYTLLVSERYRVDVPAGVLYYTHSTSVIRVPALRREVSNLANLRNRLAGHMMRLNPKAPTSRSPTGEIKTFLPPTLDDDYVCGKCYAVQGCMLYRKAVDKVEDSSSPIHGLFERHTSHITKSRAEFFARWEHLLSLEERHMLQFRKELWTMTAAQREISGRCLANMIMLDYQVKTGPRVARIHQHTYKFVRGSTDPDTHSATDASPNRRSRNKSLLNGHIVQGDPVIISMEPDFLALARGFVLDLTPHSITVGVDHAIDVEGLQRRARRTTQDPMMPAVFRLDRDELTSGMSRLRENLARMFYAGGDMTRLRLVVDLDPPTFSPVSELTTLIPDKLNSDQRAAMIKVLTAKDYALILGMPGTGKTFTIAEIIKCLVADGKSVLLASYTHSAVDTILSVLKDVDFKILRLGNIDKVHPDVRKFTLDALPVPQSIEQFEHQVLTPPVVATTCLSLDHALFFRREFDYCIVDEASQITLPACLGPLRYAKKFVLVGDHFQLPPLVRDRDARQGGLDVSLFRRLTDAHPHAVVDLTLQYRMNQDIMLLSNKLIYNDRLRPGSAQVATRSLVLPNRGSLHADKCALKGCWLKKLMDEKCSVSFVDTDAAPARESRVGDLVQNQTEAELTKQLVTVLLEGGIQESQIAIITLYRQQVKLLSHMLQDYKGIEILTADKSQGRDKDCVIFSMVRSNDTASIGDLLKDWRRLNVSFTRSRSKLILIGSRITLQSSPLLADFFKLMSEQDWVLQLPPDADKLHEGLIKTNKKRTTTEATGQENALPVSPRKAKRAKVEQGLLRGRPILQEVVMNDNS